MTNCDYRAPNEREWNLLDLLSSADFPGATGRRTGKTINGTTTNFLYDGVNAVQEFAGGTPSANLLTGLGIDEVFSRTDSLGTRSFLTTTAPSERLLSPLSRYEVGPGTWPQANGNVLRRSRITFFMPGGVGSAASIFGHVS